MRGANPSTKPSLLQMFLLSMAGIALLFSAMAVAIWVSSSEVIRREKQLVNELLPELDVVYKLTAATAGLQTQGFLLRSAPTRAELLSRRSMLDTTIEEILSTLDALTTLQPDMSTGILESVKISTDIAIGLAKIKEEQIKLRQQIHNEMPARLGILANLKAYVEQQVVELTEQLVLITASIESSQADNTISSMHNGVFDDKFSQYESISLSLQDHLLFNQDVVELSTLLQSVPLLNDKQELATVLQNRQLLVSALAGRSIYMSQIEHGDSLLERLRQMRLKTADWASLFELQETVLSQEQAQDSLYVLMQEQTAVILEKTGTLQIKTNTLVDESAKKTLEGLNQFRVLPLLLSALAFSILGSVSYWLLYRKTVMPMIAITRQLDNVGSDRFPQVLPDYSFKETAALSSATKQLDVAQKDMHAKDRQLQGINRDLQRANEDLQQFAHIASHDLQEPLRKMQQFSDLLEEDYGPRLDDEARYFIDTIRNSAHRMSVLIKETLAYSRSGSANQKLTRVDLSQLIYQLLGEMDVTIRDADGEFQIDDLPWVLANELGMSQLFRNLMVNALKYRKPGTPARVRIRTDHAAGKASGLTHIRVEDNGIGIPAKYLQRIFIPFERLQISDASGTGLGLAICKKVCEFHGWTIEAISESGVGTTFLITIPRLSIQNHAAS